VLSCGIALTIGLGMGLICSLFTVFEAYVLRPFAVHDPYSLYEFQWKAKGGGLQGLAGPCPKGLLCRPPSPHPQIRHHDETAAELPTGKHPQVP
jgi:hypothetical protein